MRALVSAAIAAAAFALQAAQREATPSWTIELAPLKEISMKADVLGKALNNQMLPLLLMSSTQQYFMRKFGKFKMDSPLKFAAYPAEGGSEVTLVYPYLGKAARMVVDTPGAGKTARGNVRINDSLYAAFSAGADGYCAFATSEALAENALAAPVAPCPEGAIARFAWPGGDVTLRADNDGLYTETNGRPPTAAPFAKDVPWLAPFVPKEDEKTHRIVLDDLKQAVLALARYTFTRDTEAKP